MGEPNQTAPLAYIAREFPGQYEEVDGLVTVGTSPALVVLSDPERMSIGFSNVGPNDVYMQPKSAVGNANGILLLSGGGSLTLTVRDDLTLVTMEWWAYSVAAGGKIFTTAIRRFTAAGAVSPAGTGGGTGA